jgi:glycosyltransferase involved in cell wall biosynthesis
MVPRLRRWKWNLPLLIAACFGRSQKVCIARGVLATQLAYRLRRMGLIDRVVYDGRGAVTAEWQEFGQSWAPSLQTRIRDYERSAVTESNFRIAVSRKLVAHWRVEFGYSGHDHVIVPCTVNHDFEAEARNVRADRETPRGAGRVVLVYSGSVAGWQGIDRLTRMVENLLHRVEYIDMLFLCPPSPVVDRLVSLYPQRVRRDWTTPEKVPAVLSQADVGLLIREKSVTNQVASPVKLAEYLACGLPVLISDEVGDYSEFVREHGCGRVVVESLSVEDVEASLAMPTSPRKLCVEHFLKDSPPINRSYERLLSAVSP